MYSNSHYFAEIYDLIPSVIFFIESVFDVSDLDLSDENTKTLTKFSVICLEIVNYLIDYNINVNYINLAIKCSDLILSQIKNLMYLETQVFWFCSAVNSLYKFVDFLLSSSKPLAISPKYGLSTSLDNTQSVYVGESCNQLYTLVTWLYKIDTIDSHVPQFFFQPIKRLVVSFSRLSLVNSYILIPAQVWNSGWTPELFGDYYTQVPPLPIEFLQEVDILEEFIFR